MSLRSPASIAVLVGLVALGRILELARSHAHLRKLPDGSPAADSRSNWTALVALQGSWLAGAALEPALRGRAAPALCFWGGLALFALGAAMRLWCIRSLGPAWNARARVALDLRVVRSGPYRWIRHPNYLGVLLELAGLPLAGGAWLTLFVTFPTHVLVLRRRMRGEDRLLSAIPGYTEAMGGKGALWPGLGALRGTE